LKNFLGGKYPQFVEEFLACISSEDHQARCRVIACIGTPLKADAWWLVGGHRS
jgi:hypothetical protein